MADVEVYEGWVEVAETNVDTGPAATVYEGWVEVAETNVDTGPGVAVFEAWAEVAETADEPPPQWYPSYVWTGSFWIPLFPPGDWPFEE